MLVAATYPEIIAVVTWVASGVMFGGTAGDKDDHVAAWTYKGCDLPFLPLNRSAIDWNRSPVRFAPGFVTALSDTSAVEAAEIPVEHINGPVFLISGTDDQVWPSNVLAAIAVRRLSQRQHPFAVEHLCYEGAGHMIGPPHPYAPPRTTHTVHPVVGYDCELGGTPELNAQASADSWEKILNFLKGRFASV